MGKIGQTCKMSHQSPYFPAAIRKKTLSMIARHQAFFRHRLYSLCPATIDKCFFGSNQENGGLMAHFTCLTDFTQIAYPQIRGLNNAKFTCFPMTPVNEGLYLSMVAGHKEKFNRPFIIRTIRHNSRWRKGLRQTQCMEVVYQYTSILIKVNQPVSLFWHGTYVDSCTIGE